MLPIDNDYRSQLGVYLPWPVGRGATPIRVLITAAALCCLVVSSLGMLPHTALLLPALLVVGVASSITALLQFTTVQRQTPDHMRGRVSAVWSMQDVVSDSVGTVALGALVALSGLLHALVIFGGTLTVILLGITIWMRKPTFRIFSVEPK